MAAVSKDELATRRDELKAEILEFKIELDASSERMTPERKEEWNRLNAELDDVEGNLHEREAVEERITTLGENDKAIERLSFQTARPSSRAENIYDLSTVRRSYDDPSVEGAELRDRAKRAVEGSVIPHPDAERVDAKGHVERMIESLDSDDGRFSRYLVATNAPAYRRAFPKLISPNGTAMLTREEQAAVVQAKAAERALSLTGSAGGFAVPFVLDPTIIPTSNLAVNPLRGISRVEQITVDEWRGVSSAGITAAYAAEVTEVGDNAPTLAQPTVSTEKAQAFIPFSIEIGQDWSGLQAEMARLLQDAKDELEATKFVLGSGTNEPFGVITGATTTQTTATSGAFVVGDLYNLEAALGPRFRPRASMMMNRFVAQKIRQFDTAGGASLWIDNLQLGLDNQVPTPGNYGARVLGYGAYESSAMDATLTTGSEIIVFGDFSYFLIADRVGLSVELIPHMFATANNRPSGQRGLYAYWRNGSKVLSANAFRVLTTTA